MENNKEANCNELKNQVLELGIMSNWHDTLCAMEIIKLYDTNSQMEIIEFGSGNAGWPILVSKICKVIPIVYAWESFQHVHYDFSLSSDNVYKNLAKDKDELTALIDSKISNHNIEVVDKFIQYSYDLFDNDENKYDIIRLDCLESYYDISKLLEYILRVLKPGGLLFIDDIDPKVSINRFRAAMKYDDKGELCLTWVGVNECAFQKLGATLIDQIDIKNNIFLKYGHPSNTIYTNQDNPKKTYLRSGW